MTCPSFALEMNSQLDQARRDLDIARESEDQDAIALAEARIADLADVTRRHGVDVHHVTTEDSSTDLTGSCTD
jgi:hypothetical protein